MAYYDAFKAKWAQAPAGTAQSKLDWVNAATVVGPAVKMIVPAYEIYNRTDRAEYNSLNASNSAAVQRNLAPSTVDYSSGSALRAFWLSIFPAGSKTQQNLAPYVATFDTPQILWVTAPTSVQGGGYQSPMGMGDVTAAGLS